MPNGVIDLGHHMDQQEQVDQTGLLFQDCDQDDITDHDDDDEDDDHDASYPNDLWMVMMMMMILGILNLLFRHQPKKPSLIHSQLQTNIPS